jgi:hypothetical protein
MQMGDQPGRVERRAAGSARRGGLRACEVPPAMRGAGMRRRCRTGATPGSEEEPRSIDGSNLLPSCMRAWTTYCHQSMLACMHNLEPQVHVMIALHQR